MRPIGIDPKCLTATLSALGRSRPLFYEGTVNVHSGVNRPVTVTIMTNGGRGLADCDESISDNSLGKLLVLLFWGIRRRNRRALLKLCVATVARAVGRCSEISILRENRGKFMKFILLFCIFPVPQSYCNCYCYDIILLEICLLHPLVKSNKRSANPKLIRWLKR